MPALELDDVSLYFEVHGQGPPLLMIAGLGMDLRGWIFQVDELSKKYRLIIFDNRGAGRTKRSWVQETLTISQMAKDATSLLTHLNVGKAYVLGVSMGGFIAQEMAAKFPERIERLVLANTTARLPPRARQLLKLWNMMSTKGVPQDICVRERLIWTYPENMLCNEQLLDHIVDNMLSFLSQTNVGFVAQSKACLSFDGSEFLNKISAPSLIIASGEDIIIPFTYCQDLANHIPNSTLKDIQNGGHSLITVKPKEFNEAVISFLDA